MALTEEGGGNGFYMPVAPAYGGGFGNNSGFGGDWAWILLLLVLFGGWGNRGGYGNGFGSGSDSFGLYPWLNNSQHISDGFRDQMLNTNISSISDKLTSGFGDIATQLCAGFAGVTNGFNQAQITNMQSMYGIQSALQQCCCDNRAATADLKYTVATENCADRYEAAQNTRDIIDSQTRSTQSILDKLCQLELDGKQDRINDLERQLTMANLAASQIRQTADIQNNIVNELRSCPIPSQPVYGSQPIFTCNNNSGCGCGGNF